MPGQLAILAAYPDVDAVLHTLLASARSVLRDHFIGLYLSGSLASGDFNPQTSDIDFLELIRYALDRARSSDHEF